MRNCSWLLLRPEIAHRIESILPAFSQRLLVKPGMTGLAQLRLPADTDIAQVQHKLAHDLFYLRNLGPLLDVRILASTVLHVLATGFGTLSRLLLAAAPPIEGRLHQTETTSERSVTQEALYAELASADGHYGDVSVRPDLTGRDRILLARRNDS